jgi:two-component system, OmpR family, response regulator
MRVLVVEDNDGVADAVERGLRAEGFDVDVSDNGLDGLWRAREFGYDLIVLDILLPKMNGYEMCRTLRSNGVTTPILMLTAKDGEYDVAEGLELGADDYLTKPFSFVVLVARIHALIRRSGQTPASSLIEIGDLRIDSLRRTVTSNGDWVDLTAREFALLEAFGRRAGHVLTRGELLDLVWGADRDGFSNVVDVYVGYLRRKLDAPTQGPGAIESVRGVGYRLADR